MLAQAEKQESRARLEIRISEREQFIDLVQLSEDTLDQLQLLAAQKPQQQREQSIAASASKNATTVMSPRPPSSPGTKESVGRPAPGSAARRRQQQQQHLVENPRAPPTDDLAQHVLSLCVLSWRDAWNLLDTTSQDELVRAKRLVQQQQQSGGKNITLKDIDDFLSGHVASSRGQSRAANAAAREAVANLTFTGNRMGASFDGATADPFERISVLPSAERQKPGLDDSFELDDDVFDIAAKRAANSGGSGKNASNEDVMGGSGSLADRNRVRRKSSVSGMGSSDITGEATDVFIASDKNVLQQPPRVVGFAAEPRPPARPAEFQRSQTDFLAASVRGGNNTMANSVNPSAPRVQAAAPKLLGFVASTVMERALRTNHLHALLREASTEIEDLSAMLRADGTHIISEGVARLAARFRMQQAIDMSFIPDQGAASGPRARNHYVQWVRAAGGRGHRVDALPASRDELRTVRIPAPVFGDGSVESALSLLLQHGSEQLVLHQLIEPRSECGPATLQERAAGMFRVRMCVDGWWRHLIVDDAVPGTASGEPAFARDVGPKKWYGVPLLHKALVKSMGSYDAASSGDAVSMMEDLSGCTAERLDAMLGSNLTRQDLLFLVGKLEAAVAQRRTVVLATLQEPSNEERRRMKRFNLTPNMFVVLTAVKRIKRERTSSGEEKKRGGNNNDDDDDNEEPILLQLRHSWDEAFTHSGPWGVDSDEMKKYRKHFETVVMNSKYFGTDVAGQQEIFSGGSGAAAAAAKDEAGKSDSKKEDGTFWMSAEDAAEIFDGCSVLDLNSREKFGREVRVRGTFLAGGVPSVLMHVTSNVSTEVLFGLVQMMPQGDAEFAPVALRVFVEAESGEPTIFERKWEDGDDEQLTLARERALQTKVTVPGKKKRLLIVPTVDSEEEDPANPVHFVLYAAFQANAAASGIRVEFVRLNEDCDVFQLFTSFELSRKQMQSVSCVAQQFDVQKTTAGGYLSSRVASAWPFVAPNRARQNSLFSLLGFRDQDAVSQASALLDDVSGSGSISTDGTQQQSVFQYSHKNTVDATKMLMGAMGALVAVEGIASLTAVENLGRMVDLSFRPTEARLAPQADHHLVKAISGWLRPSRVRPNPPPQLFFAQPQSTSPSATASAANAISNPNLLDSGAGPTILSALHFGVAYDACTDAVATLLAMPVNRGSVLRSVFCGEEDLRRGFARVKMLQQGWWQDVIVDTWLPYLTSKTTAAAPSLVAVAAAALLRKREDKDQPFDLALAATEHREAELWVPLLQKALAKSAGSYDQLLRQSPATALRDIIGSAVVELSVHLRRARAAYRASVAKGAQQQQVSAGETAAISTFYRQLSAATSTGDDTILGVSVRGKQLNTQRVLLQLSSRHSTCPAPNSDKNETAPRFVILHRVRETEGRKFCLISWTFSNAAAAKVQKEKEKADLAAFKVPSILNAFLRSESESWVPYEQFVLELGTRCFVVSSEEETTDTCVMRVRCTGSTTQRCSLVRISSLKPHSFRVTLRFAHPCACTARLWVTDSANSYRIIASGSTVPGTTDLLQEQQLSNSTGNDSTTIYLNAALAKPRCFLTIDPIGFLPDDEDLTDSDTLSDAPSTSTTAPPTSTRRSSTTRTQPKPPKLPIVVVIVSAPPSAFASGGADEADVLRVEPLNICEVSQQPGSKSDADNSSSSSSGVLGRFVHSDLSKASPVPALFQTYSNIQFVATFLGIEGKIPNNVRKRE